MSEYWKKLQDPRWQKRRLELFSSAEFKCEECGDDSKQLHAHHLRYVKGREPWEYEDFEMRCMCDGCHKKWHQIDEWFDIARCALSMDEFRAVVGFAAGLVELTIPENANPAYVSGSAAAIALKKPLQ